MEEGSSAKSAPAISIQPRYVYGLQTNARGNIHFTLKQEVIYPVAGVLAFQDFVTNKQTFLRFAEGSVIEIIVMSPNRKLIAIAERAGDKSYVNIYELPSNKKRRKIILPPDFPNTDVYNIIFTYDSKGIVVLSKEPDAFIALFYFDKAETVVTGRVSNRNQKGLAKSLAVNPNDSGLVAIGGDYTLKLMNKTEKGMILLNQIKTENIIVTSLTWLTADIIVAGLSSAELLVIEACEVKAKVSAHTTDVIDITSINEANEETDNSSFDYDTVPPASYTRMDVLNLTTFATGFAYSVHNVVHIFERSSSFRFIKKTINTIPMDLYPEHLYAIKNIAINHQQDTIIVTSQHAQIYIGMVFVPETIKVRRMEFRTLGESLHIDGIISMSICSWKPILMTAGKDQTVRIWNYETGQVELVKKYLVDVSVIGLHPAGILVAVGFSDQLRLMEIMLDDLKIAKTFNFPKCTNAVFSHQGHLLVVSYEYTIVIISVFSFEILRKLTGHNGSIEGLAWSLSDESIFSVGTDGAVYEWRSSNGVRANEIVHKGTEYNDVVVSSDRGSIYTVTNLGTISEISNSTILREIRTPDMNPLKCIAISRSDLVMFAGTEKGHLYNVQVPFMEAGGGRCVNTRFFHTAITKMCITYDDLLLATANEDGTLVFWTILNNEGRIASMDSELLKCRDVMISRNDLIDKIENITSLELRIEQQKQEFLFAREQGDSMHSEAMREIHEEYCAAIEELKEKNEAMADAHTEEFNIIAENIQKTREEHEKKLLDLENEFHDKIIIEYEKSSAIKKTMEDMREDYELKLRKSAGCLQDTIEALETDFRKQLHERQELIRQLTKEIESKKTEFMEYCRQVEADNDRRMVESQLNYEHLLKEEQGTGMKWRGEAGVIRKKFATTTKENLMLRSEITKLQTEHERYQKKMYNYEKDIDDLKREIEERESSIRDKEKKSHELLKKNQELEKYKQVLQHKINELKAQIEPRERELKEKKDQIADMEKELEGLQASNLKLELQLADLSDKYHGCSVDLRKQRVQIKMMKDKFTKICADIYHVAEYIQNPPKLKTEVRKLFQRYSADTSLKKMIALDDEVEDEFGKQRCNLEKMVADQKAKGSSKDDTSKAVKLMYENVTLIEELNKTRFEYNETQKKVFKLEALFGLTSKSMSSIEARKVLNKAVANYDEIEEKHNRERIKLEEKIKILSADNEFMKTELFRINK